MGRAHDWEFSGPGHAVQDERKMMWGREHEELVSQDMKGL